MNGNEKQLTANQTVNDSQPMRLRVLDLPMPPELAKAVKERCQKLGIWRRKYKKMVEEELKLQYHFGGQSVVYLLVEKELFIVAAGTYGSEEFEKQWAFLSPEELRSSVAYPVSPWDSQNEDSILNSLFSE